MGKNGEKISEKVQKTAVFGLKSGKNSTFLKKQFASDSVIRVFESLRPSQKHYILWLYSRETHKTRCFFYAFLGTLRGLNRHGKVINNLFSLLQHKFPRKVRVYIACHGVVGSVSRPYGNDFARHAALLAPGDEGMPQFVQVVGRKLLHAHENSIELGFLYFNQN